MTERASEIPRGRLAYYAVPAGIFVALGTVGVAFMPYFLAKMPLVLIALSPLFRHLVLVSPSVDTWALFGIGLPRHFAPDPFMYFLGRDYGPAAIEWVENNSPGMGRAVRTLERLFAKVGVFALLVSPELLASTLAGAARVPFPVFCVFNLLGTFGTIVVAKFFGVALTAEIGLLTAFFQKNLLAVTLGSVVLVTLFNWWTRRGDAASSDDQ